LLKELLESPKHVISLFLAGGPSQVDMFDPKPDLVRFQGQRPGSVTEFRTERQTGGLMPTPFTFRKRGQSGIEVSDIIPNLASIADDLCVIRSTYSFNPTHTPATSLYHTGTVLLNRPSLGSWISYGLGSENQNLPGFVALGGGGPGLRSGFLPAEHQGANFDPSNTDPERMIRYIRNRQIDPAAQRRQLDLVQQANREHEQAFGEDPFLEGRIRAMETAFHIQSEATDAFDIRGEPAGHFVVLTGYDEKHNTVTVADPYHPDSMETGHFFEVNLEHLVCAIMLGVMTYDGNLLSITKS
jgi:hypothetical protein